MCSPEPHGRDGEDPPSRRMSGDSDLLHRLAPPGDSLGGFLGAHLRRNLRPDRWRECRHDPQPPAKPRPLLKPCVFEAAFAASWPTVPERPTKGHSRPHRQSRRESTSPTTTRTAAIAPARRTLAVGLRVTGGAGPRVPRSGSRARPGNWPPGRPAGRRHGPNPSNLALLHGSCFPQGVFKRLTSGDDDCRVGNLPGTRASPLVVMNEGGDRRAAQEDSDGEGRPFPQGDGPDNARDAEQKGDPPKGPVPRGKR